MKFANAFMKVTVLENEKAIESIQLDLSSLLFPESNVNVSTSCRCLKKHFAMNIIFVTSDLPKMLKIFVVNMEVRSSENYGHLVFGDKYSELATASFKVLKKKTKSAANKSDGLQRHSVQN